jgi:hypothetical protein
MRHGLGISFLFLLGLMVWPGAALAVDGDGETTFTVPLKAYHGLSIRLEADDDEVELTVGKPGQLVVYFGSGEVSPEGFTARFGGFGEFVLDYEPFRTLETHGPYRHCTGEPNTTTEGFFRGTLHFRGEGGYVQVDASRVKGTLVLQHQWECDYRPAVASRGRGSQKPDDEATLAAWSPGHRISFAAIGSRGEDEPASSAFFATSSEVVEGVGVARFTFAGDRSDGFRFDYRRGRAFVDPPAPFAGSAHFIRRPDQPDRWSGSLTAPLLGLGRVRLAGPEFAVRLEPQLPYIE